jgi:hypothetical protein
MDKQTIRVLNLGAGVQSSSVYLMARDNQLAAQAGELLPFPEVGLVDWCVFSDTQDEPASVYRHLAWLQSIAGPKILIVTAGKLSDDLVKGVNRWGASREGARFSAIPAYTAPDHTKRPELVGCSVGRVHRQCTRDYKIRPIEQGIRRLILGLAPRRTCPKHIHVEQIFGISWDERKRRTRIIERYVEKRWATPFFPLCDMHWFRDDCEKFLAPRVPHKVPRSACTFCPFRSSADWLKMKTDDPESWAEAVRVDEAIRSPQADAARDLDDSLYLHKRCIPLAMVDLEEEARKEAARKPLNMFDLYDCGEGMCGL